MALDLNKIKESLKKPNKQQIIHKAVLLERRLRFHTEANVEPRYISTPVTLFLDWVKSLLPKDKYSIFLQLFKLPVQTVPIIDRAYEELERVFSSKNYSASYQFTSSELLEDWLHYKKYQLQEPEVWRTQGWKNMKIHPNSVLIVDLPVLQTGNRPSPYFYWLDIKHVIDYESDGNGKLNWIIFRQQNNRIAAFDEQYIRVLQLNDKHEVISVITEAKHDLGYCPAKFFWTDYITAEERDIKKNPIVKELSDLDWYLFFAISKRHLDLYAPYPIYSAYEADCNFENNETGDYCDGGFLRNADGDYKILRDGTLERCPRCGEKRIAGPGSFLEVPIPNMSEGIADMRNPIQITTIDRSSLDYNVKELERLRDEIIVNIVGTNGNVSEKEAINETQVIANFESKTSVLNALKLNYEEAQRFIENTICRLRYGNEFISSSINWGTEFYVYSVNDLYAQYSKAKENGAANSELEAISKQILDIEYRNDTIMHQRMLILKQLEPYQNMTFDELQSLLEKNMLDEKKFLIKINFDFYIKKFERENMDIVEFASNLALNEKINIITKKLYDYANEDITAITEQQSRRIAAVQTEN